MEESQLDNDVVARIISGVQERRKEEGKHILIAITGVGGSGKTTLCQKLQQQLGCCSIFELDRFYYEKEKRNRNGITGAHPEAFDKERAHQALLAVKHGKTVRLPKAPIEHGMAVLFKPEQIVLVDGQTALFVPGWKVLYDYVALVECPEEVLWERKKKQGDSREIFELRLRQFEENIRPYRDAIQWVVGSKL